MPSYRVTERPSEWTSFSGLSALRINVEPSPVLILAPVGERNFAILARCVIQEKGPVQGRLVSLQHNPLLFTDIEVNFGKCAIQSKLSLLPRQKQCTRLIIRRGSRVQFYTQVLDAIAFDVAPKNVKRRCYSSPFLSLALDPRL